MTDQEFFNSINKYPIQRGQILLFPIDEAQEVGAEILNTEELEFLGFDAFILTPTSIQPLLEYSPDYSKRLVDLERFHHDINQAEKRATHIEFVIQTKK